MSDTGRYKCVAANTAGEHEKEFDVTVHGRLFEGQKGSRLPLLYMAVKKILKFSVIYLFIFFISGLKSRI